MKPTTEQLAALLHLYNAARGFTGTAGVCAKLLLGLYNGQRFPFDLNELRRLDTPELKAALTVIEMDSSPSAEVHVYLQDLTGRPNMGDRFEVLAHEWRLRGRCSREALAACQQRLAQGATPPASGFGLATLRAQP